MIFQQVLDEIHLHNVCVLPELQNKGLGHFWLDYLETYAKTHRARDIILEVRTSNLVAKSFYTKRGYREIGLRKVMGASSANIINLLLKQMSGPVIIANVIAWPIGWYAMTEWLETFTYRIDLLPYFAGVAAASILVTLSISWITTGGHALKVSRTSPIHPGSNAAPS